MTLEEILERVKTLSGKPLWDLMRQAAKKNHEIFMACYARAKEINKKETLSWVEAVHKFEKMTFPTWSENSDRSETFMLGGFCCDINQTIDGTKNVRTRNMVLMNPYTNTCIISWFTKGGEANFN